MVFQRNDGVLDLFVNGTRELKFNLRIYTNETFTQQKVIYVFVIGMGLHQVV